MDSNTNRLKRYYFQPQLCLLQIVLKEIILGAVIFVGVTLIESETDYVDNIAVLLVCLSVYMWSSVIYHLATDISG